MPETATLLSPAENYAVVQLPGRNYPGIVFQGDSARSLLGQIEAIGRLALKHNDEDLDMEIGDLRQLLSGFIAQYETVCAREGIQLPYQK